MTDWGLANCIGETETMFSDRLIKEAKRICLGCPVRSECLQWALTHQEAWGVWAGLDYQQLRIVAVSLGYQPPNRQAPEHGTEKGWAWHRRQRTKNPSHTFCQPCVDAYNANAKIRVARYRKRKQAPL